MMRNKAHALSALCQGLNCALQKNASDCSVTGLCLDSREVQAGDVYIAMQGEVSDGHAFIAQAIERGAMAIIMEKAEVFTKWQDQGVALVCIESLRQELSLIAARFFDFPSKDIRVAGVTGTNGKTSISFYTSQLYQLLGRPCAQIGTLGMQLGEYFIATQNTTPHAIALQSFIAEVRSKQADRLVMEVSSHALEQGRVDNIAIDVAVFTNLSHDHLDYHQTFEDYFQAKAKLFAVDSLQAAVINIDDEYGVKLKAQIQDKSYPLFTFSLADKQADLYVTDLALSIHGFTAVLHYRQESVAIQAPLIGAFNISNMLAAIAILLVDGVALQAIAKCLPNLQAVTGRMQVMMYAPALILVDYAHTPDALDNALSALQLYKTDSEQNIITVFGCGGGRDKDKRGQMAEAVERLSDKVIVTADNPRNESVDAINQDICKGFKGDTYQVIADRKTAIQKAVRDCKANDIVLVAGKGHEDYQLINGQKHYFSDQEVLQEALIEKGWQENLVEHLGSHSVQGGA